MSCPCYRASAGNGGSIRPRSRQSRPGVAGALGAYHLSGSDARRCIVTEKEWWDMLEWEHSLEWDGLHHRSKYELTHPQHYKKTLLRGSVLI
jgi:hypothetical protein